MAKEALNKSAAIRGVFEAHPDLLTTPGVKKALELYAEAIKPAKVDKKAEALIGNIKTGLRKKAGIATKGKTVGKKPSKNGTGADEALLDTFQAILDLSVASQKRIVGLLTAVHAKLDERG